MPHRSGSFGDVYFVHWLSSPIPTELLELEPEIEALHKKVGRKVLYLTLVPPEAPVPSAEERKALDAFAQRIRAFVEHAYLVLEGQGFRASIQRSVVTGLTLFKERGFMTICGTVDEAMGKIAGRSKVDRATLDAAARGHGLIR